MAFGDDAWYKNKLNKNEGVCKAIFHEMDYCLKCFVEHNVVC